MVNLSVQVDREELLKALGSAILCVGDSKSRVEAFKCFHFQDGTVSTFDGTQGMSVSCPLELNFLIHAEKFYAYLKAGTSEKVTVSLSDNFVKVDGAKFPILLGEDFPPILLDDMQDLVPTPSPELIPAIKEVIYCLDARSEKRHIPNAVILQAAAVYSTDGNRAVRAGYKTEHYLEDPVLIPGGAAKILISQVGEPTIVQNDNRLGFLWEGKFFVTQKSSGSTPWISMVDQKIWEFTEHCQPLTVPDCLPNLKRLKQLAGNNGAVHFESDSRELVLKVENRETGIQAEERLDWRGPVKGCEFDVSLDYLIRMLERKPTKFYVDGLPNGPLLFTTETGHHLLGVYRG